MCQVLGPFVLGTFRISVGVMQGGRCWERDKRAARSPL